LFSLVCVRRFSFCKHARTHAEEAAKSFKAAAAAKRRRARVGGGAVERDAALIM